MSQAGEKLLRVPVTDLRLGQFKLDKEASHYLTHVHRASVGARFTAFDVGAATEAVATLVRSDTPMATISVADIQESTFIPRQRLVLIQAFGKGSKLDSIVRDATVLDVTELWIVSTVRSAVSGTLDAPGRMQRWTKIATEAARQCGRGNIPQMVGVVELEVALCAVMHFERCKWLLSPQTATKLGDVLVESASAPMAIMIGPEGGFDDEECAQASAAGFIGVRLGLRVLRSEAAATAALGAIAAFRDS